MTLVAGWRPEGVEYDEYLSGPKSGTFRRCKFCGDLHELSNWPDNHRDEPPPRSELAAPFFISDNLESIGGLNGVKSMADGRRYTSKAKMRAEYRARGLIEVGNEPQRLAPSKKPKPDRKSIRDSVRWAENAVKYGAKTENYAKAQRRKAGLSK